MIGLINYFQKNWANLAMEEPLRVTTYIFPGLSPFHLAVPGLIFGTDRTSIGMPGIDYRLASLDGAGVALPGGLSARADGDVSLMADADLAIIPSWGDIEAPVPPALVQALIAQIRAGGQMMGLCLGTYALAGAGLLDGRVATTHWAWADHFRLRFPDVRLNPGALYVDSGPFLTSAGVAAALDACLHQVRKIMGETVAGRLARSIVMAPHRAGGQAQFIERPVIRDPQSGRLASALAHIAGKVQEEWSLDRAAGQAGMTRRSFARHLRAQTGVSFGEWLAEHRVALACELLERTGLLVDAIAEASGFGTSANLRNHFARCVGLSPSAWRMRFSARRMNEAAFVA